MLSEDQTATNRPPTRWGRLHDYLFDATANRVGLTRFGYEASRASYLR